MLWSIRGTELKEMGMGHKIVIRTLSVVALVTVAALARPLAAQEPTRVVELTLERMVDLALGSSYRVQQLNLSIDRTQLFLAGQRARLRSRESNASRSSVPSTIRSSWATRAGESGIR